MFRLGAAYLNGEGVTRDIDAALEWLEKAASRGAVGAQMLVAQVYASEQLQRADPVRAYAWLLVCEQRGVSQCSDALAEVGAQLDDMQRRDAEQLASELPSRQRRRS